MSRTSHRPASSALQHRYANKVDCVMWHARVDICLLALLYSAECMLCVPGLLFSNA
jgi:hypothetical protein